MKNKLIIIALVIGLFTACNRDAYEAPNSFSDVSWYTSAFRNTIISVNVNNFASFSDLSQGALSHKWTVEEGSFYLKGPIARKDSVYDEFKIKPESLESIDKTVHVLFTKGGFQKVNLYNEFSEYVEFKGADDFIFPAKEVAGKWVIDTTFIVDVYDTIVPKILIRQNGIIVPHESETDEIIVEAGSTLEFVDVTTIGRPNTRFWSISGVTKTDSLSVIQFNKLGSYKGNLNISRQGEDVPGDYENYKIPATVKVIPSSLPFEVAGNVVELENQTIQIPFNGEFAPFTDQSSHFTVNVNGSPFAVSTVGLNSSNATLLEIKLQDQIYRSDAITVTYDGNGDFESTDTRVPAGFTDLPVFMFQHEFVSYDFETGASNWTAAPDNTMGTFTISTEQALSGTQSLKMEAAGGNWSSFENLVEVFPLTTGDLVEYEISIYKVSGSTFNMLGPWIKEDKVDGKTEQFWNNAIQSAPSDTWTTIVVPKQYVWPLTGNAYLSIRTNGTGIVYFDNIRILKPDYRP